MTAVDHPPYRSDIDGLRAVAVLAVLGFHAFPEAFPGGFAGVDVFFVISGFLITSILLKGLALGHFSIVDFYNRRIRRIFPALLLVLAACLAAGYFLLLADEYRRLGQHVISGVFFLANFALWKEVGYFDTAADLKPLLHLWSLGVEEQFYLLWPLLLAFAYRRGRRAAMVSLLGLLAISLGLNLVTVERDAALAFFLPHTRFWELLAGAALATRMAERFPDLPRARNAASLIGGILLLATLFWIDRDTLYPGAWALMPVVGATLLIWAGPMASVNRAILATPVFVFVGLISYPLYLWHWPLLAFPRMIYAGEVPWPVRTAAVGLAFLLAWLTYRYFERQVRFRPTVLVPVSLVAVALFLAAVGQVVKSRNGLEDRFPFVKAAAGLFREAGLRDVNDCRKQMRLKDGQCIASSRNLAAADKVMLVIGDSHARVLGLGLSAMSLEQRGGYETVSVGWSGCPPFVDVERHEKGQARGCTDFADRLRQVVAALPNLDTVVIAGRYSMYFSGHGFGDKQEVVLKAAGETLPDNAAIAARGWDETLSFLSELGKRIAIVHQVPELDFSPRRCVERLLAPMTEAVRCAIGRDEVLLRQAVYRRPLQAIVARHPGVVEFDPVAVLCPDGLCRAVVGGELFYYDNNHLSIRGGTRVGEELLRALSSPSVRVPG